MINLSPRKLRDLHTWVRNRRDQTFQSSLRKEYAKILIHINRALLMQLRGHDQLPLYQACSTPLLLREYDGDNLFLLAQQRMLPS